MEDGEVVERLLVEVLGTEQQVRRGRTVEAEAAVALVVVRDEGERGACLVGAGDVVGTDAELGEAFQQEVAEHVTREHAGKTGVTAQASRGDRDIGRRTAGKRNKGGRLTGAALGLCVEIDQRLAEAEDGRHAYGLSLGARVEKRRPAYEAGRHQEAISAW